MDMHELKGESECREREWEGLWFGGRVGLQTPSTDLRHPLSKFLALVYDIVSPTTVIIGYTIGVRKLSPNLEEGAGKRGLGCASTANCVELY